MNQRKNMEKQTDCFSVIPLPLLYAFLAAFGQPFFSTQLSWRQVVLLSFLALIVLYISVGY